MGRPRALPARSAPGAVYGVQYPINPWKCLSLLAPPALIPRIFGIPAQVKFPTRSSPKDGPRDSQEFPESTHGRTRCPRRDREGGSVFDAPGGILLLEKLFIPGFCHSLAGLSLQDTPKEVGILPEVFPLNPDFSRCNSRSNPIPGSPSPLPGTDNPKGASSQGFGCPGSPFPEALWDQGGPWALPRIPGILGSLWGSLCPQEPKGISVCPLPTGTGRAGSVSSGISFRVILMNKPRNFGQENPDFSFLEMLKFSLMEQPRLEVFLGAKPTQKTFSKAQREPLESSPCSSRRRIYLGENHGFKSGLGAQLSTSRRE